MDIRSVRSGALGVIAIARQFGVRITADAIESALAQENIKKPKDLEKILAGLGVTARFRRPKFKNFQDNLYYYPCVALFKDGTARIVVDPGKKEGEPSTFTCIDPLDPVSATEILTEGDFLRLWTGLIILVSKRTGIEAQDRIFGWPWFLPELLRHKWLLFITILTSVIVHLIGLAPIIFIQISFDKVLGYGAISTLYVLAIAVILALIFGGILNCLRDYIINFIATSVEARLSGDLFDKLLALPAHIFQTTPASELEDTLRAASHFRAFISRQILANFYDAVGILIFLPMMIRYSPILALIAIGFTVVIGLVSLFGKLRERELVKGISQIEGTRNRSMRETISGIETIKTYSLENRQRRDWRQNSAQAIQRGTNRILLNNILGSINSTLQQFMSIAIIFVGVILVMGGDLSAGAIIACSMLSGKLTAPIRQLITFFADSDGIKRSMELVGKTWNGATERGSLGAQHVIKGQIVLRDVTINFENKKALDAISVTIPARGKIAVVGRSASGKSTLLRICQGLLFPNTGVMEVDGHNFRSLDTNNYRSQVAMVDTYPVFFTGTIEENLRIIRPNISDRELEETLHLSGFSRMLKDLPDGLSTEINQFGAPLSEGNRIALSVARSLVKQPRILLLDEALANLDKSTQLWLLDKLDEIARGRTLIMATNELRFVVNFDSIIVLDSGSLSGQGTHSELLENCIPYKELWELDRSLSRVGMKDEDETTKESPPNAG
jgi:ATP-binding cassette subfamily B protein